jgi:hypothetical protein
MDSKELLTRVLVVADWSIDAHAVIEACERRNREGASSFGLVVPAWLHGLDWAGDPRASVPCAQLQLAGIAALAAGAGRGFDMAAVGDPEPVTALGDALAAWPADEILICSGPPPLAIPHPVDLNHRVRRATKLPVRRSVAPPPARARYARCHPAGRSSADALRALFASPGRVTRSRAMRAPSTSST